MSAIFTLNILNVKIATEWVGLDRGTSPSYLEMELSIKLKENAAKSNTHILSTIHFYNS